jgi:hypothetical protein
MGPRVGTDPGASLARGELKAGTKFGFKWGQASSGDRPWSYAGVTLRGELQAWDGPQS